MAASWLASSLSVHPVVFFRFNASHGAGDFDREGLRQSILARAQLTRLSRERVRAELLKLLIARRAPEVMRVMSQAGVIEVILGMGHPARLERLAAFEAAQGKKPDAILRLAAFAVLTVEDAERLRDRLRLSNDEAARLAAAARAMEALHGIEFPPPVSHLREMLFVCGARAARDGLALAFAASGATAADSRWREAADYLENTPAPVFPLKGKDLIARGLTPGKNLGATLNALQKAWIRAGFPRDPAVLQALVDSATGAGDERFDP